MKVSAKEQHGLRAMANFALRFGEGPVPLSEIARAQDVSLDYLEQVVPALRDAGLLDSTRGAKGGYQLSRPPGEITVGEVLRALDGAILPFRCIGEGDAVDVCTQRSTCTVRTVWRTIHDRVSETLDSLTLDDL